MRPASRPAGPAAARATANKARIQPAPTTAPPHAAAGGAAPQTNVPHDISKGAQPQVKKVAFGELPVVLTCPQCFRRVKTNIEREVGRFAKLCSVLFCCSIIGIPFFWLPLVMDYFMDMFHVCPNCNGILYERQVIQGPPGPTFKQAIAQMTW